MRFVMYIIKVLFVFSDWNFELLFCKSVLFRFRFYSSGPKIFTLETPVWKQSWPQWLPRRPKNLLSYLRKFGAEMCLGTTEQLWILDPAHPCHIYISGLCQIHFVRVSRLIPSLSDSALQLTSDHEPLCVGCILFGINSRITNIHSAFVIIVRHISQRYLYRDVFQSSERLWFLAPFDPTTFLHRFHSSTHQVPHAKSAQCC